MVRGRFARVVRAYLVKGVAGSLLGVFSSDFSLTRAIDLPVSFPAQAFLSYFDS